MRLLQVVIDALEDDLLHVGLHAAGVVINVVGVERGEVFAVVGAVGDHVFVLEFTVFCGLDADEKSTGTCDSLGDLGHP